jgi:hypothetical protein
MVRHRDERVARGIAGEHIDADSTPWRGVCGLGANGQDLRMIE